MTPAARQARWIALVVPAVALAGAYASQYLGGLYPCEMCWWQRYGHFAALALALVAFVAPPPRLWTAFAGIALAVVTVIAGYHAGVEYGWFAGITGCTSDVRFGGGQDPMAAIMNAPLIRCDAVQWSLFHISLAGFDFLWSGAGTVAVFALLLRKK